MKLDHEYNGMIKNHNQKGQLWGSWYKIWVMLSTVEVGISCFGHENPGGIILGPRSELTAH